MKHLTHATAVLASLWLSACGGGGGGSSAANDVDNPNAVHVYEKKQLEITPDNVAIVSSVIFELENFARTPLDMLNEPYLPPAITLPNLARTQELNVADSFKGDVIFDANFDEANPELTSCTNGEVYQNQPTYEVHQEKHSIVDGTVDVSQQAVLSYWFAANHCNRETGDEVTPGEAQLTGAIWFTAQWVKDRDGALANFNGVVKTVPAAQSPQDIQVPEYYPDLYINYGERNEVRFDTVETNMGISGDQFSLTYKNVALYSEFDGTGGSLELNTLEPILLSDRYIPHRYSSGKVSIVADQNTQLILTLYPSYITADATFANGETSQYEFTYQALMDAQVNSTEQ